jgi:hypothetical protein
VPNARNYAVMAEWSFDAIAKIELRDDAVLREWLRECAAAHEGEIPFDVARRLCVAAAMRAGRSGEALWRWMERIAPVGEPEPGTLPWR